MDRRLLLGTVLFAACGSDAPALRAADEADLSLEQVLGKRLFEDTALSEPGGQACASCHDAATGFTGTAGSPVAAVAQGSRPGVLGRRNTPTLLYAALAPDFAFVEEQDDTGETVLTPVGGQFWDGRAVDLVEQVKGPLLNAREMGNASAAAVVAKVRAASYAGLFRTVYAEDVFRRTDVAFQRIAEAIAAYERSARFRPFRSRFDEVLRGRAAFTPGEERGFALFQDPQKGNCIACHAGTPGSRDPADWPFTDWTYDDLGLPRNPAIPDNADPGQYDRGLCARPDLAALLPPGSDTSGLCGAFKVPTLRNVGRTAPYGHNGVFPTLHDVVRFYVTRSTDPARWYPRSADGTVRTFDDGPPEDAANVNVAEVPYDRRVGEAPRLTEAEIDDLVAFLRTLDDPPGDGGSLAAAN